jgi:hypothetical protein
MGQHSAKLTIESKITQAEYGNELCSHQRIQTHVAQIN